jgi:hypothetical protein
MICSWAVSGCVVSTIQSSSFPPRPFAFLSPSPLSFSTNYLPLPFLPLISFHLPLLSVSTLFFSPLPLLSQVFLFPPATFLLAPLTPSFSYQLQTLTLLLSMLVRYWQLVAVMPASFASMQDPYFEAGLEACLNVPPYCLLLTCSSSMQECCLNHCSQLTRCFSSMLVDCWLQESLSMAPCFSSKEE